jgi:hypothetical protein
LKEGKDDDMIGETSTEKQIACVEAGSKAGANPNFFWQFKQMPKKL